jgi:hypothetical protein
MLRSIDLIRKWERTTLRQWQEKIARMRSSDDAPIRDGCSLKITTISKVIALVISSVVIQTAVAGHAAGIGKGPPFGGGLHSTPASGGATRFSFGARPTFGRPVIGRSRSRITGSPGRSTTRSRQRDPISSIDRQPAANSRPQIASRMQQPGERAGGHIFSRQNASVHRNRAASLRYLRNQGLADRDLSR